VLAIGPTAAPPIPQVTLPPIPPVAPSPVRQAAPPQPIRQIRASVPYWGSVPADYHGLVSVRVSALLAKLGINDPATAPPWFRLAKKQLGLSLTDVERVTCFVIKDHGLLWLLEGTGPLPEQALVAVCLPNGAQKITYQRDCLYTSPGPAFDGKSKLVLHFASPKLLIAGSEEGVKQWLHPALEQRQALSNEGTFWEEAAKHDIFVGSQDKALKETYGIRSAQATVDLAECLSAEVRCSGVDVSKADDVAKLLRGYRDLCRSQILMFCAMSELGPQFPGSANLRDKPALPSVQLLRRVENGLRHAATQADGTTVRLTASIAVDGKTLRTELDAAMRPLTEKADGQGSNALPFPFSAGQSVRKNVSNKPTVR
jgi:hypothetical protein